jgi:hypothetical protein
MAAAALQPQQSQLQVIELETDLPPQSATITPMIASALRETELKPIFDALDASDEKEQRRLNEPRMQMCSCGISGFYVCNPIEGPINRGASTI